MSDSPIIAAKTPAAVELVEGQKYFWCRCGRSANQPFCDGSHAGTGITPLPFTADKSGTAYLCRCKGTASAPRCDGTHAKLGDADVGDPAPSR